MWHFHNNQTPAKFGNSVFSNIITGINTGIGVYSTLQQPGGGGGGACRAPAGCFQCHMTGQGDIAGCLDDLARQIYPLRGSDGWIQTNEAFQVYQRALAAISNAALFLQTNPYLIQMKGLLARQISHYQEQGNTITSPNTTVLVDNQGNIIQAPGMAQGQTILNGVSNTVLFGGAMVAVLGLIYLTKR